MKTFQFEQELNKHSFTGEVCRSIAAVRQDYLHFHVHDETLRLHPEVSTSFLFRTNWDRNSSCASDLQNNRSFGDFIYLCFFWELLISRRKKNIFRAARVAQVRVGWCRRRSKKVVFDSRRKFRTQPGFFTLVTRLWFTNELTKKINQENAFLISDSRF